MGHPSENGLSPPRDARSKYRVASTGMAALASLLLTNCGLYMPDIDEVRYVQVRSVEAAKLDIHDGWKNDLPLRPLHGMLGEITVATTSDLRDISGQYDASIRNDLTLCGSGSSVFTPSSVYYQGVRIDYGRSDTELQRLYQERAAAHAPNEPYLYEIYFAPRSNYKATKGPGQPKQFDPYDFTREPRHLCLRIRGGTMLGGSFISNTVIIPADDLRRAFENLHD